MAHGGRRGRSTLCVFFSSSATIAVMTRLILALFLVLLSERPAQSTTLIAVTTRAALSVDETLDWGEFGPADTDIVSGSTLTMASGLIVTVSQPYYGLQVRQEDLPANLSGSWSGDFLPYQYLLTNWNSPFPVTLSFSQPIFGAGVQIEPGQVDDLPAPFTAYVTAYDGSTIVGQFSTDGIRSRDDNGSAPFLGVSSDTAAITSLTYRVVTQTNGTQAGDLGMNFLSIESVAPVPEPCSILLVVGSLAMLRRRTTTK